MASDVVAPGSNPPGQRQGHPGDAWGAQRKPSEQLGPGFRAATLNPFTGRARAGSPEPDVGWARPVKGWNLRPLESVNTIMNITDRACKTALRAATKQNRAMYVVPTAYGPKIIADGAARTLNLYPWHAECLPGQAEHTLKARVMNEGGQGFHFVEVTE